MVIVLKIKSGFEELVNDVSCFVFIFEICFFCCRWVVSFVFVGFFDVIFIVRMKLLISGI